MADADLRSRWISKACKASWTCSRIWGSPCSGPPSATAPSCPGACPRSTTCRAAGGICRSREATGCGGGTTMRCSGTPPTRSAGSPSYSRPVSSSGQAAVRRTGSASTPLRAERTVTLATRRTPSSAFGPATCTRSRSTTGCCEIGPTQTRATRPGARTHSSSPWSAPTRAGPASASPWAPVPGRSPATTSR